MHERFRAVTFAIALSASLAASACSDAPGGGDGGGGAAPQAGGTGGTAAATGGQADGSGGTGNPDGGASATGGGSSSGGTGNASGGTNDAGAGGSPGPDPGCGSIKWACWPMPNTDDGLPNPASYVDGGDGTVLDEVTELVWEQDPADDNGTWDEALAYCEALELGGKTDWRLPTRIEMTSVLDYGKPGWAEAAFPGAPGAFHRSASDWILTINQQGAGAGTDYAWAFNMSDGIVSNAYSKASDARYRCVRSEGSGEGPSEPAVQPPDQYTVLGEGEVQDNYTGLIWEAGDSDEVDHAGALDYCSGLALGGQTWRLPSIRELATLVDEAKVGPAIDESMFPGTKYGSRSNNWYWAADLDAQSDAAWALNFDDGFTGTNKGAEGSWNYFTAGFARCVR